MYYKIMKYGVYLLLGLVVIIRSNGVKGSTPYCQYDNEKTKLEAKCYHMADIEAFDPSHYTPLSNLSTHITSLTLQTTLESKWYIDSFDFFTKFENLQTLQIYGPMAFAEGLMSDEFRRNFLNIPSLKTLALFNNDFNSHEHMWELPLGLKNLTVIANKYTEFDLKRNPYLEAVHFHQTPLLSLPLLTNPPPPLNVANFRKNPHLEIKVDNLASLCTTNALNLDADNLQRSDQYCECIRIKKWINEILKQSEEDFFDKTLNCVDSGQDCQNYTLDTALQKREECVQRTVPKVADHPFYTDSTQSYNTTIVILACLVAGLTIISLVSFIAYQYFVNVSPDNAEAENLERRLEDDVSSTIDQHEPEYEEMLHEDIDFSKLEEPNLTEINLTE